MRLYETTFIVNPQTDDATIDRQVKDIADIITNAGGKIVQENRMGTRRMAYLIRGLAQGYYANLVFEAPATTLADLERHFRFGEAYLRNLTVLFEGELEKPAEEKPVETTPRREPVPKPAGDGPVGRRDDGTKAEKPAEEKPTETDNKPAETVAPVEATPEAETPAEVEAPAETAPVEETPVEETTPETPAATETPAEEKPVETEDKSDEQETKKFDAEDEL